MMYFVKTIQLFFIFIFAVFHSDIALGKNTKFNYSKENIANYFSGIVSVNQNNTTAGFKYLNKVKSISNFHENYNIQFIHSLVLLDKFDQAFIFSKDIWEEDKFIFEVDLLLGIDSFLKKDYLRAKKHFKRLNRISRYNLFFDDFFGNLMISWVHAAENNKKDSFKFFEAIPNRYEKLKKINYSFLQCFFDLPETESAFSDLSSTKQLSFSRYNFFLANYLLSKNKNKSAETVIENSRDLFSSNLLIKETEIFLKNGNSKEITNIFNCQNTRDSIAEIFYIVANLYSSQKDYKLSNFYLKISLFLNKKFIPNKALLAENYLNQKKNESAKKVYYSIKSFGPTFAWHAHGNLATIIAETLGKEKAVKYLEKEINLLPDPNFENYYDIANFYKNHEYYMESVKYYSLALNNMNYDSFLIPKVLDRRGTSYERMGEWDKAEKDLLESIQISPDQPHVLNYLAYSWIEKRMNLERSLEMLKKANNLRKNDGYIIDSLGWGYFVSQNYIDAKKYLQRAVEIFPLDPIINDHYADTLWMLNKPIQARYIWQHVLSLDKVEEELRNNINKKLVYGVEQKL